MLGGKICQAISEICSSTVQDELNQSSEMIIRTTSGGNLPTKNIVHVILTIDLTVMERRLKDALIKADGLQCRSLAIPAINEGLFTGYVSLGLCFLGKLVILF